MKISQYFRSGQSDHEQESLLRFDHLLASVKYRMLKSYGRNQFDAELAIGRLNPTPGPGSDRDLPYRVVFGRLI
jgi:hypothetical protein